MRGAYPIALFLLVIAAGCQFPNNTTITKIDKAYLQENVVGKDVQLVDVRTAEEYKAGFIDDALNFNVLEDAVFLEQIKTLDKAQPVYLYCKAGGRSNRAAELLKTEGFMQIFDYSGGYTDWIANDEN